MKGPLVRSLAVALGLAALIQSSLAARQNQASPIRILAAGGLLGQEDGMPEYPGGPFDTEVGPGMRPYGGLAGLADWLARDKKPHDLFLMTANNLPRDVSTTGGESVIAFFKRVRQLQPSAIAVGVEDFLRGLDGRRTPPTAATAGLLTPEVRRQGRNVRTGGLLVTRMRDSGLPFLVTNAAVRLHKRGLNTVSDRGFSLNVDANRSVGWVREFQVTYPCRLRPSLSAGIEVRVQHDGGSGSPVRATTGGQPGLRVTNDGPCRATLSLGLRLSPGSRYRILLGRGAESLASFVVSTDETLTPQSAIVPSRPELPIIVALVDPHVRSILAADRWRWREDQESKCAADECEILLTPPAEALEAALSFVEPAPTSRPIALLSELPDDVTAGLLQQHPRIRLVVLPPDSENLGRAALRTASGGRGGQAGGPYSGDLGYGAVLNPGTPTATQIWMRPEWFAETIHEVEAGVDAATWAITSARHASHSVKGRTLCARSTGNGTEVGYYLEDWQIVNGATVYHAEAGAAPVGTAPYRYTAMNPDLPFDRSGQVRQGTLWTNLDSFAAVALDAMRTGFRTDLAVLPSDAIDDNWLTYLREDAHAPTQWLSRLLLERLLFRAGTIVKVRVAGSALFSTLNSMVSAARADDARLCVSGVNAVACGSPRFGAQTFVNSRRLDRNRYYTIALPESVALEAGLNRYGSDEDDLVYLMDRVFAAGTGDVASTCTSSATPIAAAQKPAAGGARPQPLAAQLERRQASRNGPYFFIKPAEFSFTQTEISEPAAGQGLFGRLSIPNSGARPSRRVSVAFTVDSAIVDKPGWAIRVGGRFAYGRAVVNDQSSTDPNLSEAGIRLDWKIRTRGRFFGGLFWETQFADQVSRISATRSGNTVTLPLVTRRRDYRHVAGGFELEVPQFGRWLSIDPLRVSAAIGASMNEHVDIAIDGERQGLAQLQQFGTAGLLSRYFATHPGLSSSSTFEFIDEPLRRARVQIDATPRIPLRFGERTIEVSVATSYRRFVGANVQRLAEKQSATTRLTMSVPLVGLATLNLNLTASAAQVHGIPGWFRVVQPSVSVSVPVITSRRAGWVF